jgi:hypothetical protein
MKLINLKDPDCYTYNKKVVYALTRAEATRLVIELVNQLGDPTLTNQSQGSSSYIVHDEKHLPVARFSFLVEENEKND